MNWALEHIQILLAIAAIVAAWVKKLRANSERRAQQTPRAPIARQTVSRSLEPDPAAAERTRMIQEEIRRKIEERARMAKAARAPTPPALPASPAALNRPRDEDPFSARELERRNPATMPRPDEPARLSKPIGDLSSRAHADAVARSAAHARERVRRKEERNNSRDDAISIRVAPIALIPSTENLFPANSLRATLNDCDEVRRAIVLSEILQPPVALR